MSVNETNDYSSMNKGQNPNSPRPLFVKEGVGGVIRGGGGSFVTFERHLRYTFMILLIKSILLLPIKIAFVLIGFLLSLVFIGIPTFLYNPSEQISLIETDLGIDIPEEYEIVSKSAEYFIFEYNESVTFKFSKEDSDMTESEITSEEQFANGKWAKEENVYKFKTNSDFSVNNKYLFWAEFNPGENSLTYNYSSL